MLGRIAFNLSGHLASSPPAVSSGLETSGNGVKQLSDFVYQAVTGFCFGQNGEFWEIFWLSLQCKWFVGFCQIAISPLSTNFFQQRLLATFYIPFCSRFKSPSDLSHPLWELNKIKQSSKLNYVHCSTIPKTRIFRGSHNANF